MCDVNNLKLTQQQVLQDIQSLLLASAAPSDASALKLNLEIQRQLEQLRLRMLELLQVVRSRYKRNEQILINRQKRRSRIPEGYAAASASKDEKVGISGAVLRGGTFLFKGNLYFRDVDGRSCPNNEDYQRRCSSEMFPTDFDMRSKHVWTVRDKKNIIMGVKQQLLDHATYPSATGSKDRKRKIIDLHVQSLGSLLRDADSSFSIDWLQISTLDLDHRHSAYSCEAMWLVYLQPQIRRDDWTPEEDRKLLEAIKTHKLQDWQAIAAKMDRRSDYQCFVRMHTSLRFQLEPTSSVKWSYQDSERLRAVVLQNTVNGLINWTQVVDHFPNRSRSTLIGRYLYVLHPSISHEPFTQREDVMLFAAVEEYDGKFNCFPRTLFPNRSLAQLRTRYQNVLAQRNKTDSWSVMDDKKLIDFVTQNGASNWVDCADHLGNHTRTSCRTRFLTIKRFLEHSPDASVADIPRRKKSKNAPVTAENWEQRLQEWQEDPDSMLSSPENPTKPQKLPKPTVKRYINVIDSNMEPLRGVDVHIYEYFKYAYNLKLHSPAAPIPLPRDERNFHTVVHALRFQPSAHNFKQVQSVYLSKQLSRTYNKMMRQLPASGESEQSTQLLPPNWSTMMGFRSICILSAHCRNVNGFNSTISCDESQPAVQLFRERLRTLFYRTTLLSRLETSVFETLPAALMQLPRPAINYGLTDISQQLALPACNYSDLKPEDTSYNVKSETADFKDEPSVKVELSFE